jgi:hypothetical protein
MFSLARLRCHSLVHAFVLTIQTVSTASAGQVHFTISNPSPLPVATVARVSLPVPAGFISGQPPAHALLAGKTVTVQAKEITRHPDGSIRRVMISVPVHLQAHEKVDGVYPAGKPGQTASPSDEQVPTAISTDHWQVVPAMDRIELRGAGGVLLAAIETFGPETCQADSTVQVLDSGRQFVWLRYDRAGDEWGRQCDVQVFHTGEIRLTHRIQAKLDGDHWTPDFGWTLTAPKAQVSNVPKDAVYALGRDPNSCFTDEDNADLIAEFQRVFTEHQDIIFLVSQLHLGAAKGDIVNYYNPATSSGIGPVETLFHGDPRQPEESDGSSE